MNRPEKSEYAEFYAGYVARVEETDVVSALRDQLIEIERLFAEFPAEKADYRYAAGKWSVKELLEHLIDAERVFAYRALRIARGDQTPLAGFAENDYVTRGNAANRAVTDLVEEFLYLRQSNVLMFEHLPREAWTRTGMASDARISVRALAYIMVGHLRHHLNILQTRYLI